ncbi:MAG: S-adenosylmethionine:tRNA ribosyltransferase-isomerase, partial [Bacteroidota bacterium]
MKLSSFGFELPKELIANYPIPYREDAKLMVVRRTTGQISHHIFNEITTFFSAGDVVVLNDTKVAPIYFKGNKEKTGASINMLLLRELSEEQFRWDTIIDPARKIRVGNKLYFGNHDLFVEVVDNTTSRGRTVRFAFEGSRDELLNLLDQLGNPPIKPILGRKAEPIDRERYQTVYASKPGSVVAPIGGFHFTEYILKSLELQNVHTPKLTLHLGCNSLGPLDAEDLEKYKHDSDPYDIPPATAEIVNQALDNKKKVCAVDVSTLQALESSISSTQRLKPKIGWSNTFIRPPYKPQIANALLTNFYSPKSIPFVNTA